MPNFNRPKSKHHATIDLSAFCLFIVPVFVNNYVITKSDYFERGVG